jgi:hypothetical protein
VQKLLYLDTVPIWFEVWLLNGFPPTITKQTQKQLKRKNNEASYCHFTVAWTVCFWKPGENLSKEFTYNEFCGI